jgi:hypothetical protein
MFTTMTTVHNYEVVDHTMHMFYGDALYICDLQSTEKGNIQLLYGFRVWMAWSKHAGMLRELRKARETRDEGEWFCALFLTRAIILISSKVKSNKLIFGACQGRRKHEKVGGIGFEWHCWSEKGT